MFQATDGDFQQHLE